MDTLEQATLARLIYQQDIGDEVLNRAIFQFSCQVRRQRHWLGWQNCGRAGAFNARSFPQ
ncbi:hypothetical protein D3C85_1212230 [compost metagenome]